MSMTVKTVKTVAGIALPTGAIVTFIVMFMGSSIFGWPGTVDDKINILTTKTAIIAKDVETHEKFDIEQRKINEKNVMELKILSTGQHEMALEVREQGTNIKYIVKMLEEAR